MERLQTQHFVINLKRREDRRREICHELNKIGLEANLFPAIEHEHGILGCAMSHIECLKLAQKNAWDYVLIFEDDAVLLDPTTLKTLLAKYLKTDFDVLHLGCQVRRGTLFHENLIRLHKCYCSHAYIVRRHYYPALIANLEEGLELKKKDVNNFLYNCDVYLNSLVEKDKWYCLHPSQATQREGYSDNSKAITDMTHLILNPRLT
jgi:GR25 family glycosyltransferase involved in LPS biosynthesis